MRMNVLTATRSGPMLLMAMLVLLAGGCGFHLKGDHGLPARIGPVAVQGIDRFSPFHRKLTEVLQASGVTVTADAATAKTILSLQGYSGSQFVTAIDSEGKAAEYELFRATGFTLKERDSGQELVPFHRVEARRLYAQQSGTGFGTSLEREEIVDRLEAELADDIVRAIAMRLR